MEPSAYQRAILDAVRATNDNLLIQARAGSGKTSTLVMIAEALGADADAIFLAFNKSIATELSARLPFPASTFHAAGFRAVGSVLQAKNGGRRVQVDARKCESLFDRYVGREYASARQATLKLVSLMKASALLPGAPDDTLLALIDHYGVECEDESVREADIIDYARSVLAASNADYASIDFDDMLYLVAVHNVKLPVYDYVMVDESQDTNEIQRVILRKLVGRAGRLIAVGDDAQAIYGFRGADADSMALIRAEFACRELPLSISYRCPASVVRLAQTIVPDILPRENAPEGLVTTAESWKLTDFQSTDLVVCRNTAPLVTVAYRMISARMPCKIMGRDIGRGLVALLNKIAGKRTSWADLYDKLVAYRDTESARALARGQDGKAQSITDKVDSLLALYDGARSMADLAGIIESLFTDNGGIVTTFATIHKSKGMEAPRVFVLDRALMPSKYARQTWEQVQERNLQYVAYTRALAALTFIESARVV